jgi:hypothetical protein
MIGDLAGVPETIFSLSVQGSGHPWTLKKNQSFSPATQIISYYSWLYNFSLFSKRTAHHDGQRLWLTALPVVLPPPIRMALLHPNTMGDALTLRFCRDQRWGRVIGGVLLKQIQSIFFTHNNQLQRWLIPLPMARLRPAAAKLLPPPPPSCPPLQNYRCRRCAAAAAAAAVLPPGCSRRGSAAAKLPTMAELPPLPPMPPHFRCNRRGRAATKLLLPGAALPPCFPKCCRRQ